MTTALERVMAGPAPAETVSERPPRSPALLYGPLAVAMAVFGGVVARDAGSQLTLWLEVGLITLWAIAGTVALRRRPEELTGVLVLRATAIAALACMCAALLRADAHGTDLPAGLVTVTQLGRAMAAAVLPVAAMHTLLGLPDGRLPVAR